MLLVFLADRNNYKIECVIMYGSVCICFSCFVLFFMFIILGVIILFVIFCVG